MEFELDRKKRPSEKFPISVDFTNDINAVGGDAAASHVVTAKDDAGADVSATILTGATLTGNVSKVTLQVGNTGRTYYVFFKVTTNAGHIYEHSVTVPVLHNA